MPRVGRRRGGVEDPRDKLSKLIKALLEDPDASCLGGSELCCSGCSGGSDLVEILAAFISQNDAARRAFASAGGLEAISILLGRVLGGSWDGQRWRLEPQYNENDPTSRNETQAMGALVLLQCFCASREGESILIVCKPVLALMVCGLAQADEEELDGAKHAALQVLTGWHVSPLQGGTEASVVPGLLAKWLMNQASAGMALGVLQLAEAALTHHMLPVRKSACQLFSAAVVALPELYMEAFVILDRMTQSVLTSIDDRAIPGNHHSIAPDIVRTRAMLMARHISGEREKLSALGFLQLAGDLAECRNDRAIKLLNETKAACAVVACYCSAWGLPHHERVLGIPSGPPDGSGDFKFQFKASPSDANAPDCEELLHDFQSREQALDALLLFVQNGAALALFPHDEGLEASAVRHLSRILVATLSQDTPGHIRAVTTILGRVRLLKGPASNQLHLDTQLAADNPNASPSNVNSCDNEQVYGDLYNISCYLFDLAWESDFKDSASTMGTGVQTVPSFLRLDSSDSAFLETSGQKTANKQSSRLRFDADNQEAGTAPPASEACGRSTFKRSTNGDQIPVLTQYIQPATLASSSAPQTDSEDRQGVLENKPSSADQAGTPYVPDVSNTKNTADKELRQGLKALSLDKATDASGEQLDDSCNSREAQVQTSSASSSRDADPSQPNQLVSASEDLPQQRPVDRITPITWPSATETDVQPTTASGGGSAGSSGPVFPLPPETKPVTFGVLGATGGDGTSVQPIGRPDWEQSSDDIGRISLLEGQGTSCEPPQSEIMRSLTALNIDIGLGYRVILQVLQAWRNVLESDCPPSIAALDCSCWWQRACLATTHDRPQVVRTAEHVASMGQSADPLEGLLNMGDAARNLCDMPAGFPLGPLMTATDKEAADKANSQGTPEEKAIEPPSLTPIAWSPDDDELVEGIMRIDPEMQEFLRMIVLDEDFQEDSLPGACEIPTELGSAEGDAANSQVITQHLAGLDLDGDVVHDRSMDAGVGRDYGADGSNGEDGSGLFIPADLMMSLSMQTYTAGEHTSQKGSQDVHGTGMKEAQELEEALAILPDLDKIKAASVCLKYDTPDCSF